MKQNTQDLTQGSLWKKILFFSFPLMISNVLQVLFNLSDIAVVGQFSGSKALGAVGSTVTLVTLFTGFLIGVGSGVNVLVARFYGAKKDDEVVKAVHTAAIICVLVGLMIALTGLFSADWVLRILHTKEELMDGARRYLQIYFLGMPAMAVYNFGNAVFSAVGDTKKPLYFLSFSGVVNVLLNLFFVIVCRLDVTGVALASVISQYLSAGLIVHAMCKQKNASYGINWRELRIDGDKAKLILAVGLPAGFQTSVFQVANLFIQAGVNSFSATMVSGNAAAANADALVYDVMAAFYTACSSFMGQNFGAGKKDRVKKSYFISLFYSFAIGAVMGLLLVIFGQGFLSLFTREAPVVQAGMQRLTIMGCSYAVSAFMDCTIAASRGLGKSLIPTVIVLMGSVVFRIVWMYTIFAYFKTIPSLYLLYISSWTITAIAEILYLKKIYPQCTAKM